MPEGEESSSTPSANTTTTTTGQASMPSRPSPTVPRTKQIDRGSDEDKNNPTTLTSIPSNRVVVCATREDFEEIALIQDIAFAEKRSCGKTSEETVASNLWSLEYMADNHPELLEQLAVVKDDGKVIAACQVLFPGDPRSFDEECFMVINAASRTEDSYVVWIGTHPDFQGRKAGSMLLDWVDRITQERGLRRIVLYAMSKNKRGIRFYERNGYKKTRETPKQFLGQLCCNAPCLYVNWGFEYFLATLLVKHVPPAKTLEEAAEDDP